jgi:tetratricopeptide (TPR) repeat protein
MPEQGEEDIASYKPSAALPAETLRRAEVLKAIEDHDFGRLFYLARKWAGISYAKIADSTGIKPERVGSLARRRGSIKTYEKIAEIADGMRIPGHLLGLTPRPWEGSNASGRMQRPRRWTDEATEVRSLLRHAADITMGIGSADEGFWLDPPSEQTPTPRHVGAEDVTHIEQVTAHLRALDYQHGGGACREAVVAQSHWVGRLLDVDTTDDVRRRLHLTLADLHNLAGWTSMDMRMYSAARRHFAHALAQSRPAQAPSLMANVLYRTGRLHLHRGLTVEALRFFQLGQIAAQDSGDSAAVAVLCANEAWAYGYLGDASQALRSLNRAADELGRAEASTSAPWVGFFGATDLKAMTGMTHLELSSTQPQHLSTARENLEHALAGRTDDMARSRAFETTALAVACLRDGDDEAGLHFGWQAATMAEHVRSGRVLDRLAPLASEARALGSPDGRDLDNRIAVLTDR